MSTGHAFEAFLVRSLAAGAGSVSWERSLRFGALLGDTAHRLGLRRRVVEENLAGVVPPWSETERRGIARDHYRELGRVALEYPRLAKLVRAVPGEVLCVRGFEHIEKARQRGRGAIVLTGHYGNFELAGASLGQAHPLDFVTRPLSNPNVEAWIAEQRAAAGIGNISADTGVRQVYESLRRNRLVAMVADQDARRHGIFVSFMGRPASTAVGPARIALATGAPVIMGFIHRGPDGRHELDIEPALEIPEPEAPDAVARLTALHTERLERQVRRRPEHWFWLHRRWKTRPLGGTGVVAGSGG